MALNGYLQKFTVLIGVLAATAAQAQGGGQVGAPSQGADLSAIDRRIDKLEEQIVDLQSQGATLESLANNAPQSQDLGGDPSGRSGGLEAQVQALSSQIADMTQRLQQMERQLGIAPSRAPSASAVPPTANTPPNAYTPGQQGQGQNPSRESAYGQPQRPAQNYGSAQDRAPSSSGFGSTTVEPGATSGQEYSSEPPRRYAAPQGAFPPTSGANSNSAQPQPVRASSPEAKALYDQAYASITKREYDAAETYFTQFLRQYPNDALAGPAQFWLGETAFVAGDYTQAAASFLKSYTNHPNSEKAPESLLKLGVSLKRLEKGSEACSTFSELEQKFPQAQAIVQRAQAEKRRSNC